MLYKRLPKFNYEGDAHFVTSKTHLNTPLFAVHSCAIIVLEELAFYRQQNNMKILGYVVMPDHIHLVVWWDMMKKPQLSISKIMQGFKGSVARRIIDEVFETNTQPGSIEYPLYAIQRKLMLSPTPAMVATGNKGHRRNLKYKIWQTGFYDFHIISPEKLNEKLNYIHCNPEKAGLCDKPEEYPYSSAWYYADMSKPGMLDRMICPVDEF